MPPRSRAPLKNRLVPVGMAAILALALWLRAQHLGYGLPYLRHPDEARYVKLAHRMFRSGDPNPGFFRIPSLLIYANAATYYPYELVRRIGGRVAPTMPPTVVTTAVGYAPHPTLFILGRSLTLAASLSCVILTFMLARSVAGAGAGLVAAALVAVSPAAVAHGCTVTPDTFVLLFATVCALASVRMLETGRASDYALSAAGAGLAAASKYNGAFFALCPMAAHVMRCGLRGRRWAWLVALAGIASLLFLATNPFSVLDYQRFLQDVLAEAHHYAAGHPGMEGGRLQWYESALFATVGPAALAATFSLLAAIHLRNRKIMLLWGCAGAYLLFAGCFSVRNVRTLLPVVPLIAVLTGWVVASVHRIGNRMRSPRAAGYKAAVCLVLLALLAPPLVGSLMRIRELRGPDTRDEARQWCERNLPLGARIAVESYSTYLNPRRFIVDGYFRIIDNPLNWYQEQGYEYLMLSAGSYRRYARSAEAYPEEHRQYQLIFESLPLVASFTDGVPEIRVYGVAPPEKKRRETGRPGPASR